jgi:glyoxylase-like metal-dependent hydrolase (beta-lactamase superfamily II)
LKPTETASVHRLLLFLCGLCLGTPPAAHALEPVPVGPGVYAFLGAVDEPSVANGANTGNSGFIIGTAGVVVIDTGVSYRHGQRMLAAIASITDKPVRLVVLTHAMQDFVFGAAAFTERGIPMLAHRATLELMRSRCEQCREQLVQLLGEDAMHGTRLILPEQTLEQPTTIDVAGRSIELLHFGWGATPGDLSVYDRTSGVLFAGGVVTSQRIPEMRDGKLQGWLAWLDQLEGMQVRAVVPGHGPLATAAAIGATRAYLLALDRKAHALFAAGRTLLEAVDEGGLSAYAGWGGYPILHRRNLQQRYLEYEVEELERP